MDGTKILSSVENLHFLDSLNFIPMSLKSMPESFDPMQDGILPHFFKTPKNLNSVGPYHEPKNYGAYFMSVDGRAKFLARYEKQKENIFRNNE